MELVLFQRMRMEFMDKIMSHCSGEVKFYTDYSRLNPGV